MNFLIFYFLIRKTNNIKSEDFWVTSWIIIGLFFALLFVFNLTKIMFK